MGFQMQQFPQRDAGTGEHSQATEPVTVLADGVDNQPTGEAEQAGPTTHTADATKVESTGEHDVADVGPVEADWPPFGEDKAVKTGEAKAKKSTSKRSES